MYPPIPELLFLESFSEEKVTDKIKSVPNEDIQNAVNESLSVEVEKLCSFIKMVLSKFYLN
jgi:hypothetical protein